MSEHTARVSWLRDTTQLADEMMASGLRAVLTCVNPQFLDQSFAGREFDPALLQDLPDGVDPCGENGEFHTLVIEGPMFRQPIPVKVGEVVERDGFVFADVVPMGSQSKGLSSNKSGRSDCLQK